MLGQTWLSWPVRTCVMVKVKSVDRLNSDGNQGLVLSSKRVAIKILKVVATLTKVALSLFLVKTKNGRGSKNKAGVLVRKARLIKRPERSDCLIELAFDHVNIKRITKLANKVSSKASLAWKKKKVFPRIKTRERKAQEKVVFFSFLNM